MKNLTITLTLLFCLSVPAIGQTELQKRLDEVCKAKKEVNRLNADRDDGRDVRQISREQFQRLAEGVALDAPELLKGRDESNKAMDKESVLLKELYARLLAKLGHTSVSPITDTKGFSTFQFVYRQALYEVASSHAKSSFDYRLIVNRMLEAVKVRKVRR